MTQRDEISTAAGDVRAKVQSQVVRYALELVAEDMAATLMRTARSTVIKEVQDLSCALYDADGRVVVQSSHAPMLLAGSTLTMREALKSLADRPLAEGDTVTFDRVLLVGDASKGEAATIGTPYVDGASVQAEVVREIKGEKIDVIKFKRRKGYRVKKGHRQPYLRVKITGINA